MSDKLFGTDGVRGVANTFPMVPEFAMKLAMAAGQVICCKCRRVAIAKDTRISGDMLEAALSAGFTAKGIDVVRLGVMPTPVVTTIAPHLDIDLAVMITASHNPYQDNGIKLISSSGEKLNDAQTAELEAMIQVGEFKLDADKIGSVCEDNQAIKFYLEKLYAMKSEASPLQGLKVMFDCANGAWAKIAPQIWKDFGAEVVAIGTDPDGYNINRACGSTATELMQKTVVAEKAALGIAADGDGDRIIICDELGNKLAGDQIIAYLGTFLHQENKLKTNAVVATVWSNLGLEKYFRSLGIKFYRTAVGERYVIEKMKEIGSNCGGEESGHIVLSDLGPTGDCLTAGLMIAMGLKKSGRKMSEIFPLFEKCPCEMNNIRLADKLAVETVLAKPEVSGAIAQATKEIEAAGGSVIIRKSGTEPMIKVRVEAEDGQMVSKAANLIAEQIRRFL